MTNAFLCIHYVHLLLLNDQSFQLYILNLREWYKVIFFILIHLEFKLTENGIFFVNIPVSGINTFFVRAYIHDHRTILNWIFSKCMLRVISRFINPFWGPHKCYQIFDLEHFFLHLFSLLICKKTALKLSILQVFTDFYFSSINY